MRQPPGARRGKEVLSRFCLADTRVNVLILYLHWGDIGS